MTNQSKSVAKEQSALTSRRAFLALCGAAAGGAALSSQPSTGRAAPAANLPGDANELGLWNQVRGQFSFAPHVTHLNTGTVGSMPRVVLASYADYSDEFASNPMKAAMLNPDYSFLQENNRARVAQFVGASPLQVVVTSNTTEGLNWVLHGLEFNAGDEVVTTLHEHGAALSPLQVLRDRRGVVIRWLPLPSPAPSKEVIVASFLAATTPKTRVWSFCHVNYTTGLRMPVAELCALARERGILTVVDGAHALGMLDFDLASLDCDFYSTSGHKWLCGPPGTGILFVRDGLTNPHGLWPMETEIYGYGYPLLGMYQVRGQQNGPSLRAMADALDFHTAIGRSCIAQRIVTLNAYLKDRLAETFGPDRLLTPMGAGELSSGMAAFIPFANPADRFDASKYDVIVQALMRDYGIYIRSVMFMDKPTDPGPTYVLRASTHIYNSFAELDDLVAALQCLAQGTCT